MYICIYVHMYTYTFLFRITINEKVFNLKKQSILQRVKRKEEEMICYNHKK